jgi:integrase
MAIQKRGSDSYLLTADAGIAADGKRIRITKTVKARGIREARKMLAEFQTEVEAGSYNIPEKMTLTAFVGDWRVKYAEQVDGLSPLTLKNYNAILEKRILLYLATCR